jgi:hypothetical protein
MRKILFNTPEIPVKLEITSSQTKYGEPVKVTLGVNNASSEDVRIDKVKLTAMSIFQRGDIYKTIGHFNLDPQSVGVNEVATFDIELSHEDYKNKLCSDGQGAIRIDAVVKLEYGGKIHSKCEREYFTIDMPAEDIVNIMMSHKVCRVNDKEVSATIQINNKFNFTLNRAKLTIDGRNLFESESYNVPFIQPGRKVETTVKINPTKEGIHTIMVDIDCAEITDIKAHKNLTVTA